MITEAFRHCHGIGPHRLAQLQCQGIRTWDDVLSQHHRVPHCVREVLLSECRQASRALNDDDIAYFVERFHSSDRWRILHQYFDEATFFDIETTGLEYDSRITVICTSHGGQCRAFVEDDNLDDFLDLLDDTRLLVSFNGSSFDVPRVLSGFHIPELPCPHIDLRWSCYHKGLPGSLKQIAETIGIRRPDDLQDADGALAVALWNDWVASGNVSSREHLIRYCSSDVLLLACIARHVCGLPAEANPDLWKMLPEVNAPNRRTPPGPLVTASEQLPSSDVASETRHSESAITLDDTSPLDRKALVAPLFGAASPGQLRTLRRRRD